MHFTQIFEYPIERFHNLIFYSKITRLCPHNILDCEYWFSIINENFEILNI